MDVYSLSDDELIRELKRYNVPYGPILPTTRKVYQKKLQKVLEGGAANVPLISRQEYEEESSEPEEEEEEEEEEEPEPAPAPRQMRQRVVREKPSEDIYVPDMADKPSHRTTYREEPPRSSARTSQMTREAEQPQSPPAVSAADLVSQVVEEEAPAVKKGGLSIWIQLLIVLIVAFLIFLVFQNMEPAGKAPIRQLEQDV